MELPWVKDNVVNHSTPWCTIVNFTMVNYIYHVVLPYPKYNMVHHGASHHGAPRCFLGMVHGTVWVIMLTMVYCTIVDIITMVFFPLSVVHIYHGEMYRPKKPWYMYHGIFWAGVSSPPNDRLQQPTASDILHIEFPRAFYSAPPNAALSDYLNKIPLKDSILLCLSHRASLVIVNEATALGCNRL